MKQTFVKAAVLACCMAAVGCKQAPMTMGPGEYAVMTIATTDREIPSNYSATIRWGGWEIGRSRRAWKNEGSIRKAASEKRSRENEQ